MADLPTQHELAQFPERWSKTKYKAGLWRAKVVNVNDPDNRGRVQVRILLLHPENAPQGKVIDAPKESAKILTTQPGEGVPTDLLPWAEPAFPFGGFKREGSEGQPLSSGENQTLGHVMIPPVGATVWVGFEHGFVGKPVWMGTWLATGELPEEISDPANIRVIKTPAGHILLFDDTSGSERIFLATQAPDSSNSIHNVRKIDMNDEAQTIVITNTSDPDDDPREIRQDEDNQLTQILEGLDRFLKMDQDDGVTTLQDGTDRFLELDRSGSKSTLQDGSNRSLELDRSGSKSTLQDGSSRFIELNRLLSKITIQQTSNQTIIQDGLANRTVIENGGNSVTLNSFLGSVTISNTVNTITLDATGDITLSAPSDVLLGAATAVEGVCVESLITVITAMTTVFNAHTHSGAVGAPATPMVPPTIGVNSSTRVKAEI